MSLQLHYHLVNHHNNTAVSPCSLHGLQAAQQLHHRCWAQAGACMCTGAANQRRHDLPAAPPSPPLSPPPPQHQPAAPPLRQTGPLAARVTHLIRAAAGARGRRAHMHARTFTHTERKEKAPIERFPSHTGDAKTSGWIAA